MILNIAVLGLGEGRSTISASLASEKLNLVKICDRNEELCRQRANEFHLMHIPPSTMILNDPDIDIIAIYTPDHLHAGHIRQALIHGKHVVCTKPFIHDLSHARELIKLSEKNNRKYLWTEFPLLSR